MKGYMRKRGASSWQLLVHVGNDEHGKKRYTSKTVRGTKREASQALAELVAEAGRGGHLPVGPVSVETVVRDWLDAAAPRLAPATLDRYRVALNHITPALGAKSVQRLRTSDIEDLYDAMLSAGQSGASIRKVHWALRQSLARAKRRGYTATIATDGVQLPPLGEKKVHPPDSDAVRKVIEFALEVDAPAGTLLAFTAWTGCRRGEVCGLHWEDVDLERGEVLFRRTVVAVKGGPREKGTKTEDFRRIAIGPATVEVLRAHRALMESAIGGTVDPTAFVFSPDPMGKRPWYPQSISRRFQTLRRQAGVPSMRLHDLRHHSATTLLKGGISVGEVMDRHGWRTLAMVGRYRHALEAQDRAAAELLERS